MLILCPSRRGFTLVEMLCVVVILGIASLIIIPQIGSRGDLKAASAARMIMADLMYAQNRAIAKQTPQYVVFDLSANGYSLQEGSSMAILTHPVTLKPYVQTFNSTGLDEVTFTSVNFDNHSIVAFDEIGAPYSFDSISGMVALMSGQIMIASGDYTMALNIQPYTGEITVQTP